MNAIAGAGRAEAPPVDTPGIDASRVDAPRVDASHVDSPRADEAAISQPASRDPHARRVEQMFRRFGRGLMRYLSGLLKHNADAEDVLQETYLRLLLKRDLDSSPLRARAYAFTVATNLAYDRFRRRHAESLDDVPHDEIPAAGDGPDMIVDMSQALDRIEKALLELEPRCRRVFLLRTSEGLAFDAIAGALGISKRTVEREMKRALEAMQHELTRS